MSRRIPDKVIQGAQGFTRRDYLKIALWVPVALFVTDNVFGVVSVEGASMSPTLNPRWPKSQSRDWLLLNKWHAVMRKPWHRGDVVTLWSPTSSTRRLTVKRIVGLGGDTIRTLPPYPQKLVTLEPGQVWVEGDNSDQSNDSNTYGPVPISLLHSKVSGIVYPFGRLCSLSSEGASATTAQAAINTPEGRIYTLPSAINVGVRMSAKAGRAPGSESIGFGGRDGLGEGERAATEKQRTTDKLV